MSIRRSSRLPKNKYGSTQTEVKKKSCCKKCFNRCIQKIEKFCFKGIIRSAKEKMLGVRHSILEHYETAGYDLRNLRSKLNQNFKKKSPHVLFRKSIRKSQIPVKNIDLIEGFSVTEIQKTFSIIGSRQSLLKNMVDDYKKGIVSMSNIPNKSKFEVRELDKEKLNKMMDDYQGIKKRIKKNENLNADDLKKKFSVTGSKGNVLEKMIADYKMGKASATGLSIKSKFDPNKLNKEQMHVLLTKYETAQKHRKRISFMRQSKPNTLKGILRTVKDNISFMALKI